MKNYQAQAEFFKALMHPTRLAILEELRGGEQCVCHMEAKFGLRQAYISQHLMILRDAGLVTDRRDGWNIYYQVCKPEIFDVIDAMENLPFLSTNSKKHDNHHTTNQSEKKHTCPCPKCNPRSVGNFHEPDAMKLNDGEAIA